MDQGEIGQLYEKENHVVNDTYMKIRLIPKEVSATQYFLILIKQNKYIRMFWNTCFIILPLVLGHVFVSALAAFAFSKLKFRFRETLFFIYIVVMIMPFQVTLVPNYFVIQRLNLLDNPLSVILPGIFGTFGVVLLRQFMMSIPNEYIEAAKIDGCNTFQIFRKVIIPLSKEGIASLGILYFIDYWNMIEQPLVFLKDVNKHPLSLALSGLNQSSIGVAFAASFIYMIPVLLVFFYGETHLVEGVKRSGIK